MVAEVKLAYCGLLSHLRRLGQHRRISTKRTVVGVLGGDSQCLVVMFVLYLVCHVVGNVWTCGHPGVGNGTRFDPAQRLTQLRMIVCEVELGLAGGGEDGGPVRRLQALEMSLSRVSRRCQITKLQMNVVEEIGNVTLGQGQASGASRRGFLLDNGRPSPSPLHNKPADDLRLAIVQELEVFLLQVAYSVTLRVAYHDPDLNQIYLHLESC